MSTWFTVKVKFDRQGEDGLLTKVTEPFLVDALSFTEAEKRTLDEVRHYSTSGEIEIADIKKTKIAELVQNSDGDIWFRCKINIVTIDEDKGIERKSPQIIMMQASSLKNAVDQLIAHMSTTAIDYELAAVTETNILDVFEYVAPAAAPAPVQ